MEGSTLVSHRDTVRVSYDDLRGIVTPASTRHWKPVSHLELVDTMVDQLKARGFGVARSSFAIGSEGRKLFGTFDLDGHELVPGIGNAIGFRHSNDKQIAIQIVAGGRVFVCDNMVLSGDITILKRKHTWGFNLRDLITQGLDFWQNKRGRMVADIKRLQHTPLTAVKAQALLARSLYDGITTYQTFKIAYDLYFERAVRTPEYFFDCAPRTAFGLHNAYTRALKESTPNAAFNTTIALAKAFGLGADAAYVF